jgi:hypothetical protein
VNLISPLVEDKAYLTADDLREIDGALSEFKVHGDLMKDHQMKVVEQ